MHNPSTGGGAEAQASGGEAGRPSASATSLFFEDVEDLVHFMELGVGTQDVGVQTRVDTRDFGQEVGPRGHGGGGGTSGGVFRGGGGGCGGCGRARGIPGGRG